MANILLIGGCGYIGSRLFQVLNEEHTVDSVDIEWYGNHINRFNIVKDFADLTKKEVEFYDDSQGNIDDMIQIKKELESIDRAIKFDIYLVKHGRPELVSS